MFEIYKEIKKKEKETYDKTRTCEGKCKNERLQECGIFLYLYHILDIDTKNSSTSITTLGDLAGLQMYNLQRVPHNTVW